VTGTQPPMTPTMQAAVLPAYGQPMHIAAIERPRPRAGQVLVRVHASGVNPLDTKIQAGAAAHAKQPAPAVLGLDMAGVVEAVGEGVARFRGGDQVYGMVGGVGGLQGTLAEFVLASADLLSLKPENLSMREAAALPLVIITAWEGLVDRAAVAAGEKVLVQGGSGGVGHVVVQIARAYEADVYAVGSASSRDYIEQLGATFIDRKEPVADYVGLHTNGRGFDLIYDTVGGPVLDASFEAVRRFGRVVSCLGWGTHPLAPLSFRAGTYSGVFTLLPLLTGEGQPHHGEILERARVLIKGGKLAPRLDPRRFTLETIADAYLAINDGSARGKLVVDIVPPAAPGTS
jgi:NADPH2:quinone reductase